MIISTNWLADYVQLQVLPASLADRLLMSGLNHESTRAVGADTAIEIEVTSNRPDCLGHIGVAREAAVLFSRPLSTPDPRPLEGKGDTARSITVEIRDQTLCPFYSARVIRGVRVGSSPQWLVDRLRTVGIESINSIVDITNYVMLECGQPLHAFDLQTIQNGCITVRRALAGEVFTAINHKTYSLTDKMCVVADAVGPLALAGVMGGVRSEIGPQTVDILLECAQFAPLAVRAAARGLVLASASSYRFERGPDPAAVDWASRRAAAMILDNAGGMLESGTVTAGTLVCAPASVDLRHDRVANVLGINIQAARQQEILLGLGFESEGSDAVCSRWKAPTWRRDVSREIDLVEEIVRIEGYDRVPEDEPIAARPVELSLHEKTLRLASDALVGAGLCEAMTRSVVNDALETTCSPWGSALPLVVSPALVRGADRLRRTLLPSLLEARMGTLAVGAPHGDLFEIARAYLADDTANKEQVTASSRSGLIQEPLLLSLVTSGNFSTAKGLAEAVLGRLGFDPWEINPASNTGYEFRPLQLDLFSPGRAAEIMLCTAGSTAIRIGVVGEIAQPIRDRFGSQPAVSAAELRLDRLEFAAGIEKKLQSLSDFPAIGRDLNLVVGEAVPWASIAAVIYSAAGKLLEECRLVQVWQDVERLGAGKKSVVVSLRLRSATGTLSGDDAMRTIDAIVAACGQQVGATLRA